MHGAHCELSIQRLWSILTTLITLSKNWTRGSCPDGRYFWLRKDTCPATGKPCGLDWNATEMVRSGLADLVLMETHDAEIGIARPVLEDVNEKMAACDRQKRALGLWFGFGKSRSLND